MQLEDVSISRREFLLAAATTCFGTPLSACVLGPCHAAVFQLNKSDIEQFRTELLQLVNRERVAAGVNTLLIDHLACLVAEQHALDMATGRFVSHWGRDGRKPYHRYSFAGGMDAVAENVSAASNVESLERKFIGLTVSQAHMRMHSEIPPNDGHRRTILAPQHTNVGFGIALSERELRLVELYTAKYVQIEPFPTKAKPKTTLELKGRLLNRKYTFYYVEVFYEPVPQVPEMAWLGTRQPYGLPDEFKTLRPTLPPRTHYADGIKGTIDVKQDGSFHIPVKLDRKGPGVYTVVIWVSRMGSRERFAVTNACIQVD